MELSKSQWSRPYFAGNNCETHERARRSFFLRLVQQKAQIKSAPRRRQREHAACGREINAHNISLGGAKRDAQVGVRGGRMG